MTDPFLKWPGSKRQLLTKLRAILPPGNRLVEPFVGSMAVAASLDYPAYLLADSNADLMRMYQYLATHGAEFIGHCERLFVPENNTKPAYYQKRAEFNAGRNLYRRACVMLYLNRHCFNGLWRVNSRGHFNAPVGSYKKPYFPRMEMEGILSFLTTAKPVLRCQDFTATFAEARPGDVIYCDPPYIPTSPTSFTAYGKEGFGVDEQKALAACAEDAQAAGISVVISNSDCEESRRIFHHAKIYSITGVQRSIAASGGRRRKMSEIIAVYAATSAASSSNTFMSSGSLSA